MLPTEMARQLEEAHHLHPRYLYRTYSNKSNGYNSAEVFIPTGSQADSAHNTILDIPQAEARVMLEYHFLWKDKPSDEFTSWSASLLWVLQHAVRKAGPATWGDGDIHLSVLDTKGLEKPFYPATSLLRLFDIPNQDKLQHSYYEGEYLTHGRLDTQSRCVAIRWDTLISNGLFSLLPELADENENRSLYIRISKLRNEFFCQAVSTDTTELSRAYDLASLFGPALCAPVMLGLLALHKRPRSNPEIYQNCKSLIWISSIKSPEEWLYPKNPCASLALELPESIQYKHLVEEITVSWLAEKEDKEKEEGKEKGRTLKANLEEQGKKDIDDDKDGPGGISEECEREETALADCLSGLARYAFGEKTGISSDQKVRVYHDH